MLKLRFILGRLAKVQSSLTVSDMMDHALLVRIIPKDERIQILTDASWLSPHCIEPIGLLPQLSPPYHRSPGNSNLHCHLNPMLTTVTFPALPAGSADPHRRRLPHGGHPPGIRISTRIHQTPLCCPRGGNITGPNGV